MLAPEVMERFNLIERLLVKSAQGVAESREQRKQDIAESRERWKQIDKQIAEQRKSIAELAEQGKQTDKRIDGLSKDFVRHRREVGKIAHRLGRLVEDFVAPDLSRILRQLVDCPEDEEIVLNTNVKRPHPTKWQHGQKQNVEVDAMVACGYYALFNETKSQLRVEHVDHLLEVLDVAREYFPEYQQYKIIGCVAAMRVDKSLMAYASRRGLIVLALSEGWMEVQNEPDFKWQEF